MCVFHNGRMVGMDAVGFIGRCISTHPSQATRTPTKPTGWTKRALDCEDGCAEDFKRIPTWQNVKLRSPSTSTMGSRPAKNDAWWTSTSHDTSHPFMSSIPPNFPVGTRFGCFHPSRPFRETPGLEMASPVPKTPRRTGTSVDPPRDRPLL